VADECHGSSGKGQHPVEEDIVTLVGIFVLPGSTILCIPLRCLVTTNMTPATITAMNARNRGLGGTVGAVEGRLGRRR
tara:strand:+ start:113 stop:346 length:234 start_codon:yes stop_codon:yes gene_type:complete